MHLLQHIAPLLGSIGQWISFIPWPHSWVAAGSETHLTHFGEQWAVDLLHHPAGLVGSSRHHMSFKTEPH